MHIGYLDRGAGAGLVDGMCASRSNCSLKFTAATGCAREFEQHCNDCSGPHHYRRYFRLGICEIELEKWLQTRWRSIKGPSTRIFIRARCAKFGKDGLPGSCHVLAC